MTLHQLMCFIASSEKLHYFVYCGTVWEERTWPVLTYCLGIWVQGLRKTTERFSVPVEIPSRDNRIRSWHINITRGVTVID
jgi:hypothetical protein